MHPLRLWIAALLFLVPTPAIGQLLGADQDARVKAIISQIGHEVERCSLASNARQLEGPAKLQLDLDERGKVRALTVLEDLRKADVGKCIAAFRVSEPLPPAKFKGGKTIRLEFQFHPWARREKRSWTDVRKLLKDSKVEAALLQCVKEAGKDRPKEVVFAMDFALTGQLRAEVDETPLMACFGAAVQSLQLPPSETHYRVEYQWVGSKLRSVRGFVVEPDECEVEEYPCSWAETDATRVNLGNAYVKQLGERIDCADPKPALAWLEKQPHVRWVRANGCDVSLLVDGARPMSYLGQ